MPTRDPHAAGWTFDTLKEFFQARLEVLRAEVCGNDRRYEERFEAQKEAVVKVAQETVAARSAANEWRGTLNDREVHLATKDEEAIKHDSLLAVIKTLADRVDKVERFQLEKAGQGAGRNIGYISAIGIVSLIVTLITMAFMLRK